MSKLVYVIYLIFLMYWSLGLVNLTQLGLDNVRIVKMSCNPRVIRLTMSLSQVGFETNLIFYAG